MFCRTLTLIIITSFPLRSNCQKVDYLQKLSVNDTLKIEYTAGDESTEFNLIEIINTKNELFSKRIGKTLYVGDIAEDYWIKTIDEKNKILINKFIYKSTIQEEADYWSSWREEYLITQNTDTISYLTGTNKWGTENYYSFERELFKENFDELECKRKNLKQEISKKLEGKWFIYEDLKNLTRGQKIELHKNKPKNENCNWIFGLENNFKSNCSKINLKYSNKYRLDIDEGGIFLKINDGFQEKPPKILHYGAMFEIDKIEKELIILNFFWR